MTFRLFRLAPATLALALLAAGCAGYKLGDPTDLPFRSLYVAPPVNTSLAPQAAALVGTAVRREIDRSGRVAIAPEGACEARLVITLTSLEREISADRESDPGLARKWRVTLAAECTLTDARTGRAYFERRPVSAFDEVYSDSGLVAAEFQDMPMLTGRLAEAIAREVLAVW